MIILGPKTAILGPQFCRILVLGPHFWWSGGPGPRDPPGSAPACTWYIHYSMSYNINMNITCGGIVCKVGVFGCQDSSNAYDQHEASMCPRVDNINAGNIVIYMFKAGSSGLSHHRNNV